HVYKQYGQDVALNDVNLKILQGEMVVLLGASGSGKSTFLKLISFEERPTSGEVIVGAYRSGAARPAQVRQLRRGLGIVYQDFPPLHDRTVFENVALPLRVVGVGRRELHARVEEALERVGLGQQGGKPPRQLSGGQQQRVAVARALVHRPTVLLADEPTGNLDSRTADGVLKLLRQLVDEHKQTIVMVTHDPHAASMADRVLMLRDGRVVDRPSLVGKRGTQEIMVQLATLSAAESIEALSK